MPKGDEHEPKKNLDDYQFPRRAWGQYMAQQSAQFWSAAREATYTHSKPLNLSEYDRGFLAACGWKP